MFTQDLYKKLVPEDNVEFTFQEWRIISNFLERLKRKMDYNCWGLGDCLGYELDEWEKDISEYESVEKDRVKLMVREAWAFADALSDVGLI